MKFTDGLQIAAGIIAALAILALSVGLGMVFGPLVIIIPFVVLIILGLVVWRKRRETPSRFLNGLLIGICVSLLVCTACDVYIFGYGRLFR